MGTILGFDWKMIGYPPNPVYAFGWHCSYCGRVNEIRTKTCDGCGAGVQLSVPQYKTNEFAPLTTAGTLGLDSPDVSYVVFK